MNDKRKLTIKRLQAMGLQMCREAAEIIAILADGGKGEAVIADIVHMARQQWQGQWTYTAEQITSRFAAPQASEALSSNGITLLAEKHSGMRVDYSGLLTQARAALAQVAKEPGLAEMLRQLQDHITELGARWYAGDTSVVDELLQLYCVEKNAREVLATKKESTCHRNR